MPMRAPCRSRWRSRVWVRRLMGVGRWQVRRTCAPGDGVVAPVTRSTRTPADVPGLVADAREHLATLERSIEVIHESDLYTDVRGSETPDRTPKRVASPALWEPSRRGLHADWQKAWWHLARAGQHLLADTDVDVVWRHAVDQTDEGRAHLTTTVRHDEARRAIAMTHQALSTVDSPELRPPEVTAVDYACEEIEAAADQLGWHTAEAPCPDPPECANDGCTKDAEPRGDGKGWKPECAACKKYRQRTGKPREVAA